MSRDTGTLQAGGREERAKRKHKHFRALPKAHRFNVLCVVPKIKSSDESNNTLEVDPDKCPLCVLLKQGYCGHCSI